MRKSSPKRAAVTYTNNDYGKDLASSFQSTLETTGRTVTTSVPHDGGKADYSAEVAPWRPRVPNILPCSAMATREAPSAAILQPGHSACASA